MSSTSATHSYEKIASANQERLPKVRSRLIQKAFDFAFLGSLVITVTMIAIALPKANVEQRVSTSSGTLVNAATVDHSGYYPEDTKPI